LTRPEIALCKLNTAIISHYGKFLERAENAVPQQSGNKLAAQGQNQSINSKIMELKQRFILESPYYLLFSTGD
jgi:hypothetical protein